MGYHYKTQQRYFKTTKGKEAQKRYEQTQKGKTNRLVIRKRYHSKNRDVELERNKKYYEKHEKYFQIKNKEWHKKNGEKWKERKAQINLEWNYNKCSQTFVEKCFESLGASLRPDREMTFPQCCALIKTFGYKLEDVDYPPFKRRLSYFNKKRTP